MAEIIRSFPFDDLPTKPPIAGRPKVSDDLQQTLSTLVGWDKASRRLVYVSPSGVLFTSSPPVQGIINKVSTGATENVTFSDIPTTEIIVMANANNGGDIWVNIGGNGGVDTGFPLDAGDNLNISINNLKSLYLHIITSGDKAIIVYTK